MRRSRIVALCALLLATASVALAAPAQAAGGDSVLVSFDGHSYSPTPPHAIFTAGHALVPGGERTATLYVQNDSGVAADLQLGVRDVTTSTPELARTLSLRAGTATTPGAPVALDFTGTCATVLDAVTLAPHATTLVTIALALSPSAGNTTQGATASMNLQVSLEESDGPTLPGSFCDLDGVQLPVLALPGDDPAGGVTSLPFTGSGILYPALMVGSVLVGLGALVFAAARRRRRSENGRS